MFRHLLLAPAFLAAVAHGSPPGRDPKALAAERRLDTNNGLEAGSRASPRFISAEGDFDIGTANLDSLDELDFDSKAVEGFVVEGRGKGAAAVLAGLASLKQRAVASKRQKGNETTPVVRPYCFFFEFLVWVVVVRVCCALLCSAVLEVFALGVHECRIMGVFSLWYERVRRGDEVLGRTTDYENSNSGSSRAAGREGCLDGEHQP
jgi:hypothetical protein